MIEVRNVTKRYFSLVAVNDVSLNIQRGEVVGVLGPNGAGKTTLFKLIAGILKPDAGTISATGRNWPAMGYKPERLIYPNHLRVHQYLEMVAAISNIPSSHVKRAVAASLERVRLTEATYKRIQDCSKGMRQRLGLAQALIGDPPLLLVDEPSNGLDPDGQQLITKIIAELRACGKTVVLNSHQLGEVTDVCTQLVIINHGQILYRSTMEEALQIRPHTTIQVRGELDALVPLLHSLHPDILVNKNEITLNEGAVSLRRHILAIVLGAGLDVTHVAQKRVTLAEIYSRVVR